MGNHHQRSVFAHSSQRLLNGLLRAGVNTGGGFIQNQYLRRFDQNPGQCQQLFLPHGQIIALFAQSGVNTVTQTACQLSQLYGLQRLPHSIFRNIAAQRDVCQEGVRHHHRVLLHHRDALT